MATLPAPAPSFDEVVVAAQAGERWAVDRLLAEARPRAMAVAMKVLRNPIDAEDAVQDALVKIWRAMPRFEGRASFFTWLHRIVQNASVDLLRRERVRSDDGRSPHASAREDASPDEVHPTNEAVDHDTPERLLASAETGAMVRAAIASLSPVHGEVLRLRELEERSYDEIARAARCPTGTVMSRLHHARRRLSERLHETVEAAA